MSIGTTLAHPAPAKNSRGHWHFNAPMHIGASDG